jgi:hypothetical protein
MNQNFCKIENKVNRAIEMFMKEDGTLLELGSSERSVAHKLAEHLQKEFVEWKVDCEYNKDSHDLSKLDSKRLYSWFTECKEKIKSKKGTTVYPDIIIHQRLSRANLLVIEIKKTTNDDDGSCDKKKLKAFINELNYQHGLFINFKVGNPIGIEELEWFTRGREK